MKQLKNWYDMDEEFRHTDAAHFFKSLMNNHTMFPQEIVVFSQVRSVEDSSFRRNNPVLVTEVYEATRNND